MQQQPSVFLIVRTSSGAVLTGYEKKQRRESLPGGKPEATDRSVMRTAERECCEEDGGWVIRRAGCGGAASPHSGTLHVTQSRSSEHGEAKKCSRQNFSASSSLSHSKPGRWRCRWRQNCLIVSCSGGGLGPTGSV